MKDVLDWLLPLAGGSVISVLAIVGCVWGLKRLTEWAAADALAKGLADHKAKIDERLAEQQRAHEAKLEALRSELRAVESEAADLRAHSLGLEAERRRNFEAKRAEVCEHAWASLVEASQAGKEVVLETRRQSNDEPEPRRFRELVAVFEKLQDKATAAVERAGLYTADETAAKLQAANILSTRLAMATSADDALREWREHAGLREVARLALRKELGYPLVDSPESEASSRPTEP